MIDLNGTGWFSKTNYSNLSEKNFIFYKNGKVELFPNIEGNYTISNLNISINILEYSIKGIIAEQCIFGTIESFDKNIKEEIQLSFATYEPPNVFQKSLPNIYKSAIEHHHIVELYELTKKVKFKLIDRPRITHSKIYNWINQFKKEERVPILQEQIKVFEDHKVNETDVYNLINLIESEPEQPISEEEEKTKEKKVYITKYNSKRIIQKFDITHSVLDELISEIEFQWFHEYEVKHLLALKLLYSDINTFLSRYKKISTTDTNTYFEEGNNPAFHTKFDCDRLHSSFYNFKLTNEIKRKGLTNKIREWYKEQKSKYDIKDATNREIIISNCLLKFGLRDIPEFVNYDNSNYETRENYNIETINSKLENAIKNVNYFYNSNNEIKNILDSFGKEVYFENNNYFGLEKAPIKNHLILKEFASDYKFKVAYWLGEYYRIKFNKNIEFDGDILSKLGFQECSFCSDGGIFI